MLQTKRVRARERRMSLILALVLAATMLLSGCGNGATASTGDGGGSDVAAGGESGEGTAAGGSDMVVTMAMGSAWADLIPYNGSTGGYYSQTVLGLLYDRLIYVSSDGTISPRGAESWELSEDRTAITFHLSKDAKWHDGEPVKASDYLFAVNMVSDPLCAANAKNLYKDVAGIDDSGNVESGMEPGVTVEDDYTITYQFDGIIDLEVTLISNVIGFLALPEHLLSDLSPADYLTDAFWSAPIGNGPLVFESTIAGSELVMSSNQDYHLGAPKFAKFRITVMSPQNMASAMIAGDIDIGYPAMSVDDIETLEQADGITAIHVKYPNQPMYLIPNNMVYTDARVRRALDMAVDRETIAAMVRGAEPIESPIFSATKYFNPDITYTYDPDAAKALLEEAAADGAVDLSVAHVLCTPPGARERVAAILQQNFAEIGFNIEIQVVEAATMFAGFYDGTTEMGLVNMTSSVNPMYLRSMLSDDYSSFFNVQTNLWDEYYESFLQAADEEEKIQVVYDMQESWVEEAPAIFYCSTYEDYAFSSRLGTDIKYGDIGYQNLPVWEWDITE